MRPSRAPARPHTPSRRPARTATRALVALLAAFGLLVLSGCMRMHLDYELSEEDTVSGSVVMAFSDEVAQMFGMDPEDMWKEMGDELTEDLPEGASETPYAEDGYTGVRFSLADQPLDMVSGGAEELQITRVGDDYVVEGVFDMSDDEMDEFGDMGFDFTSTFDVRISVTFPGEVYESTGDVDGTTVTWSPAFGEVTEISARGSAVAGGAAPEPTETEEPAPTEEPAQTDEPTDTETPLGTAAEGTADDGLGFPWWLVGLAVGLVVLGTVIALIVRSNRSDGTQDPYAQSGTTVAPDPFITGAQPFQQPGATPPSVAPNQPPTDPYQPPGQQPPGQGPYPPPRPQ